MHYSLNQQQQEGDKMSNSIDMQALRSAQQAFDRRIPDDDMDDYPEHQYTGQVEIDGILFDFDCGTLETVEMHGDMFDADIDRTDLISQADIKAQEYWQAEQEADGYDDL